MEENSFYLSEDRDKTWKKVSAKGFEDPTLQGGVEEDIPLPELKEDAIMYIAQNPQKELEIFITTFNDNIHQSTAGSNKWN